MQPQSLDPIVAAHLDPTLDGPDEGAGRQALPGRVLLDPLRPGLVLSVELCHALDIDGTLLKDV